MANGKTSLIWRWKNTGGSLFFELGNLNRKDIDKLKIEDPFIKEIVEIWSDTFFERKIVSKDHFLSLPLLQIAVTYFNSVALGRACGAPWVSKSTHPRKFGYHVTVHRPPARPSAAHPSAPQAYQCLLSHFLATLGAQERADCTSMLSSIDSCQNRVSADQYHLTVLRAQVSTHQGRVFF